MNNAQNAREIAVEMLTELHNGQEPVSESWLVQKGFVIGRRYWSGSLSAIWFCEVGEVKVYGGDGNILKVVALVEERKAA